MPDLDHDTYIALLESSSVEPSVGDGYNPTQYKSFADDILNYTGKGDLPTTKDDDIDKIIEKVSGHKSGSKSAGDGKGFSEHQYMRHSPLSLIEGDDDDKTSTEKDSGDESSGDTDSVDDENIKEFAPDELENGVLAKLISEMKEVDNQLSEFDDLYDYSDDDLDDDDDTVFPDRSYEDRLEIDDTDGDLDDDLDDDDDMDLEDLY